MSNQSEVGTVLASEDFPTSRCTVLSIKDYGAGLAVETDLARFMPNQHPHRMNQTSLLGSRWIALSALSGRVENP